MTLDASTVVPGIMLAAYGAFWSLARAASVVSRKEERITRTLHRTTCDKCRRVWELSSQPFDPDLGQTYDRTETCLACQYEAGRMVELNMCDLTPEKIRAAFNTEEETNKCRISARS